MRSKSKVRVKKRYRSKKVLRKINHRGGHISNNAKRNLNSFIKYYDTFHGDNVNKQNPGRNIFNKLNRKNNAFRLVQEIDMRRDYIDRIMRNEYDPFEIIKNPELIESMQNNLNRDAIEYFNHKAELRDLKQIQDLKGSKSRATNNNIKKRYLQENQKDKEYLAMFQSKIKVLANLKEHDLGWKAIRDKKKDPFETFTNLNKLTDFYKKNKKSAQNYFTKIKNNRYRNNTLEQLNSFYNKATIRIRSNNRRSINNERTATPEKNSRITIL